MLQVGAIRTLLPAPRSFLLGESKGKPSTAALKAIKKFGHLRAPSLAVSAMGKDWERMWGAGLQPGQAFDAKTSAPALFALLESGELDMNGRTALVPGCGRGYDLATLVNNGATLATGLEIAPTAVSAANEWVASESGLSAQDVAKAPVTEADFFAYPGPQVDFVWDYTFFCAIDPSMRAAWGAKMAELVKPGGTLATLMFPCVEKPVGPPFGVSREAYQQVLADEFEEVSNRSPAASHPGREGQELIGVWRKK